MKPLILAILLLIAPLVFGANVSDDFLANNSVTIKMGTQIYGGGPQPFYMRMDYRGIRFTFDPAGTFGPPYNPPLNPVSLDYAGHWKVTSVTATNIVSATAQFGRADITNGTFSGSAIGATGYTTTNLVGTFPTTNLAGVFPTTNLTGTFPTTNLVGTIPYTSITGGATSNVFVGGVTLQFVNGFFVGEF